MRFRFLIKVLSFWQLIPVLTIPRSQLKVASSEHKIPNIFVADKNPSTVGLCQAGQGTVLSATAHGFHIVQCQRALTQRWSVTGTITSVWSIKGYYYYYYLLNVWCTILCDFGFFLVYTVHLMPYLSSIMKISHKKAVPDDISISWLSRGNKLKWSSQKVLHRWITYFSIALWMLV